jgi:hypothetical protein
MPVTGPFVRKLMFAGQHFMEDSYVQLNENPTNGAVADGPRAGWTDGMNGTMINE